MPKSWRPIPRTPRNSLGFDAVLLYEKDLPALQALGVASATHHLLPIPSLWPAGRDLSSQEARQRHIARFRCRRVGHGPGDDALTAFDWTAKAIRYADAITLADRVFAIAPKFRQPNPTSPFSATDLRTPGARMEIFRPAEVLAKAAPARQSRTTPWFWRCLHRAPRFTSSPSNTLRIMAVKSWPSAPQLSWTRTGASSMKILTAALRGRRRSGFRAVGRQRESILGELTASKKPISACSSRRPNATHPPISPRCEAEIATSWS